MMNLVNHSLLTLIAAMPLLTGLSAVAEETRPEKKAYLDAASAGPDFAIQGEYKGALKIDGGELSLGIQVIAEGEGKFAFAAYVGGLPGEGWDGDSIIRGSGEGKDGEAVLKSDQGRAEIKDGLMTIYSNGGEKAGELKKVDRESPTLGMKPPEGAVVLFDGTTADKFENGRMSDDKLLMEGVTSKDKFTDFQLHLEFRLAYMPLARGQARSNSGCYLQGRYEVQILDSFGLSGADNECGGIYKVSRPSQNMCLEPLKWQTYDVDFTAAKFDEAGKKTSDAVVTVKHNGVVIHNKRRLTITPGGPLSTETTEPGPLFLQDHSDPVRFRNIWVKPL